MGEPTQMRAPKNYLRVDLRDPAEAEYWQVVLDAPRTRLEDALAAVGADALDVRAYLQGGTSRALAVASVRGLA
ncbi:MAG: hypothetical protein A3E01_15790 [Gammaproteobacteria bacterium RIFCSPHIGHO2_12_FULL_63_22]|nr:MAG: hypothetical protein A3E01_15790 [Gammaproteobacteria bacterium RIFCSPHIGHO2_12_FULL_63_22]